MSVVIYHNPRCSKSRATLAILKESGQAPQVIEYLKQPLDSSGIRDLVSRLQMPVRDLIRTGEKIYKEKAVDENWSDEDLVKLVSEHPILMNRPIVVTPKGARLCRPPERVHEIL